MNGAEKCAVHGVEKVRVDTHDYPALVCPRCRAERGETA